MGGKGGLKKNKSPKVGSKKRPAVIVNETDDTPKREPQRGKQSTSDEPKAASLPAFEPLGATHTDYSEAEADDAKAEEMQLLDESTAQKLKREVRSAQRSVGGTKPTPKSAGVLYLGHIPHGFYEEQMKGFFSQFGDVTRLRLARNKKTGRSKHYGFIEFKHRDVCEIVAKAMNGYLIYSKVLVAKVMDPAQVHPETFKGADRPFKVIDRVAIVRKQHNAMRSEEQAAKRESRLLKAESKRRKQLEALGIDYEFSGYAAAAASASKKKSARALSEAAKESAAPAAEVTAPAAGVKRKKNDAVSPKVSEAAEAMEVEAPKKKVKKAAAQEAAPKEVAAEAVPAKKAKAQAAAVVKEVPVEVVPPPTKKAKAKAAVVEVSDAAEAAPAKKAKAKGAAVVKEVPVEVVPPPTKKAKAKAAKGETVDVAEMVDKVEATTVKTAVKKAKSKEAPPKEAPVDVSPPAKGKKQLVSDSIGVEAAAGKKAKKARRAAD